MLTVKLTITLKTINYLVEHQGQEHQLYSEIIMQHIEGKGDNLHESSVSLAMAEDYLESVIYNNYQSNSLKFTSQMNFHLK